LTSLEEFDMALSGSCFAACISGVRNSCSTRWGESSNSGSKSKAYSDAESLGAAGEEAKENLPRADAELLAVRDQSTPQDSVKKTTVSVPVMAKESVDVSSPTKMWLRIPNETGQQHRGLVCGIET
jgi:hypothetical protein